MTQFALVEFHMYTSHNVLHTETIFYIGPNMFNHSNVMVSIAAVIL